MSGFKGQTLSIAVGLTQGSVISPLRFSLFIVDWYEKIKREKLYLQMMERSEYLGRTTKG